MAVEFESAESCKKVIDSCIYQGVLTDWFLFAASSLRISPPLTISHQQIEMASRIILQSL
jgi:4-aminobutyrate aminotransferase-like enzyme